MNCKTLSGYFKNTLGTHIFVVLALFLAVTSGAPQVALAQGEDGLGNLNARAASQHFEENKAVEGWQFLIKMHKEDPSAFEDHKEIISTGSKLMTETLSRLATRQSWEELVETGILFSDETSRDLVQKTFPEFYDQYEETVSNYIRQGLSERARKRRFAGNLAGAEEDYRTLLNGYIDQNDEQYAPALSGLANILVAQGTEAFQGAEAAIGRGNQADAERLRPLADEKWSEAVAIYSQLIRIVPEGSSIYTEAATNLQRFSAMPGIAEKAGLPTPTPKPTPTPEPGFMDNLLGAERWASAKDYFSGITSNPTRMMHVGLIILIFIFVYWVFPYLILNKIESGGNLLASEWKSKLKLFGIFSLFGFMFTHLKLRGTGGKKKGDAETEVCPHCEKPIDNMFAYGDLVFSKCPSCKEKIVPLFSLDEYIEKLAGALADEAELVEKGATSLESYISGDGISRLTKAIITAGVRKRASDLHFEPSEQGLIVRQRVDGIMTEMYKLRKTFCHPLVSAVKVMGDMNIAEKRVPQDGKFQMNIDNTDIDVRAASSPTGSGEKISLRILDIRSIQMSTEHLGMVPDQAEMFERTIHQPHGMLLITGPTGSGKTTTIYVAIKSLTTGSKNIISIEDPIEFRIDGVNQIQVNTTAGLTFASGLRSVLRQDPDVIVVGEIRDKETAEISVNSVLTGHLVFSTLHTVDASASVARLIDLGVSPRQFADALALVVAQRLIRLVCQYCGEPYEPTDDELEAIDLSRPLKGYDFKKGAGCQVCNNTGYYRRTGIFEFLKPSDRLRIEIESGNLSTGQIREIAIQAGMRTLRQEGLKLLRAGRTTVEETARVTK